MALIKTIKLFSSVLEDVFDEPPVTKDIYDEIKRPCTYITPTSVDIEPLQGLVQETIDFTITRFGESSYKGYLQLLHYAETLAKLLTAPVMADKFACYPEDVSIDINRDEEVMECSFTVTVVADNTTAEEEAESAEELMAVLKAQLNINNTVEEMEVE